MNGPKQIEFEYSRDGVNRGVIVDHEGEMPCYEARDVSHPAGKVVEGHSGLDSTIRYRYRRSMYP
jgi:hypothetical protein